jgi:integrase
MRVRITPEEGAKVARLTIQARHSRSCPLYPSSSFVKATKKNGCTCAPSYGLRGWHNGKLTWELVGQNRKEAERALDARRGDIARRTYRVVEDIAFDEWADRWLAGFTGKENSRRVYSTTIGYAKAVFGRTRVRDLGAADVRRLLDHIRKENTKRYRGRKDSPTRQVAPATLAKHLRQMGACLEAAISEGYAAENPVRKLHKTARPKVVKSRPAYYTNDELARLWPELAYRSVYAYLSKIAVATGMRFGELAALEWSDVDFLASEAHVRKTYTDGIGLTPPKGNEARTIDLTPQAAALFEVWFAESGGAALVFEREHGGYLSNGYTLEHVLYPALAHAGIPRIGERGRKRDFHSFRHTFARIALEHGAEMTWVQKQLGHSSITLTVDTYGAWARSAEKSQAEKLAAAFPV